MKLENKNTISNGVMLNAYPDSIGHKLSDTVKMLQRREFKDVFSLFYILPTFFNSDLDRGFSIIDYNLNEELVATQDLKALEDLNIELKFDIVLNHLSVNSPQFIDLLANGEKSKYKDFFINWNTFWKDNGTLNNDGIIIPKEEFLNKLFMRKSGLPILKVPFPNGEEKPYWNTFYQEVNYQRIQISDLDLFSSITLEDKKDICQKINIAIQNKEDITILDFEEKNILKTDILKIVKKNKSFLGQMDVNAKSELVWDFYEETLKKVKSFGCKILRLDAFSYLHKEIGQTNFFNKPGTWNYLDRINEIAKKNDLILLPEIHAEYGLDLHDEVAKEGYQIYDFFLPGLMIHTIESATNKALLNWINEIVEKGYKTVNMLGCHDGIPVLDLKGKEVNGTFNKGLLEDSELDTVMNTIIERGGRVKNLYDPSGKKISYYQVNATFFSALGENENKLLLARAIQLFMPGIPQIWYLDLFAGKNNYIAADKGGSGGHKEINRTTLTDKDIEEGIKKDIVKNQLKIIRLRNTLSAFSGEIKIKNTSEETLSILWVYKNATAALNANLKTFSFTISYSEDGDVKTLKF
ncbi:MULTISPECIES: alpha-amylase family protein [Tenacibaculum]|uniref:glycosidase n=1 Tax=Tenacibaculum TaxID=104267 RepID=UPI001F0B4A1B|nr:MULTISPECIES: glycosidase [Tenacibaculum]MCH3882024.1 glycosidase [Tenacibaculum aquimarinum]MDO6599665.1 glycosidase [Tenacibaculum sp. 1_MG-2023]